MPDYTTGQDLGREWRTFVDQHDRKWGASCAKKTGHPANLLEPQFTAPLEVPHQHIKVNPNDSRLVKIDYDGWIKGIKDGEQQWLDMVQKWVIDLGIQGTIQQTIDDPPPQILSLVGPRPTRRTEPVLAAKAGNKWVLGLSTVVPEKAKQFFPEFFRDVPEVYAPADPFAEDEPTPDPFAEEVEVQEPSEATDRGDGYFVVDGVRYPHWDSPKNGWQLSTKEFVRRGDESKEDYRALAQEKERVLHVQE